ncbi:MAG TPA: patatin-like phospholipase family protein [Mycobacteriales bacterium]|jgi:NTE family protein|nr:patatin-like phospholipase family protein [Mycobacteriales bacterium]
MVALEQLTAPKADLVLEGGGVKGFGLVGAAMVLAEHDYVFPRVAGTSAGAIVASLIAAHQVAGRPLSGLETIMNSVDYQRFQDESFLERHTGPPGEIAELLLHMGIAKGEYLVEWLGNVLDGLGVRTFADLRISEDDDPGTSLPPEQRYRLVVHTSDISRGALVRLPWDYHYYGHDPDAALVVDAVRASMSIPFFFRPVTVGTPTGNATWVDGGMLSNFPITVFDRTDGKASRWPTWGVKLSARPASVQVDRPANNNFALAISCLHTLLSGWDRYHLDDVGVTARTMFVDTDAISPIDFGITPDQQHLLFGNGRKAATSFLQHAPTAVRPK